MCKVVRKELGIDSFSFHDLRHTHLTDLANAGYPPVELKRRAGHEKLTTTLSTYYHANNSSKDVALAVLKNVVIKDYYEAKEEMETQEYLASEWNLDISDELYDENSSSSDILGGDFTPNGFIPANNLGKKYREINATE